VDGFRIVKDRMAVSVTLLGGERVDGEVFVQHPPDGAARQEEPRDVLNAPEPFFPVRDGRGRVVLLAKDRVAEVTGREVIGDDEVRRASARSAMLELTLTNGMTRTGSVLLELPSGRPRLLDFLNREHERFLTLYTAEGARLINRRLIESVRPLD
jgi:hypothetical protein